MVETLDSILCGWNFTENPGVGTSRLLGCRSSYTIKEDMSEFFNIASMGACGISSL